jgi:5'-nucleotidase
MRILVTNDDGIDSIGLHVLAKAMCEIEGGHEVVVAAPDREFSGAGASLGALHLIRPEVRRGRIDGWQGSDVWSVSGPPALCVMFARLGAFGAPFDLVVSGINPGANVGRAVYHSGTVGAALTARNGNVSGVAVSQSVTGFAVEGQGWDETIRDQHWESAAAVGRAVVEGLLVDPPDPAVVINVNVPDVPLDQISEWRYADVGLLPPQTMATATLEPITGHDGAFDVKMAWGEPNVLDPATDGGTVEAGVVAITYLSRLVHEPRADVVGPGQALTSLLG